MKELLSCPFCGGEARIHTFELDGGYMSEVCCVSGPDIGCFAVSRHWATKEEWAKESAIKAWNKRVDLVKHGKWRECIFHNGCTYDQDIICSVCGESGVPSYNYCHNCGAKMDLE